MKACNFGKVIRDERGSSILESMIAIILLCLIFFGVMQIFHYAMGNMICRYAAFNGAKSWSLGYTKRITEKTVRLSAMGISGKDNSIPKMKSLSKSELFIKMQQYMMTGNADVDFLYWNNDYISNYNKKTQLRYSVSSSYKDKINIRVRLEEAPLLTDGIGGLLQMGFDNATLKADHTFYNHSHRFLKR